MPRKIRELKADLVRSGFLLRLGKGDHTHWTHPRLRGLRVTLAGHDGDDAKRYQEADVREANTLQVISTPTCFINGERVVGLASPSDFFKVIDKALARDRK